MLPETLLPRTRPEQPRYPKISITLPADLLVRVDHICEVTGRNRSDVIRALMLSNLNTIEASL